MLKALSGPYSGMQFMPTGGIKPHNVKDYLSQKNVLACGGTWIVPDALLTAGKFDEIESLVSQAVALRNEVR
jgi:2-dehydro-3-deoxyphosphogluconate aldolase / (4S)-4-hydroxy-2-oxoglutarate aldolase